MPEHDIQGLNVSADGVKGLALMVPAVGLPVAFLVLNGVMVAGAGVLALSAALAPFSGELVKAIRQISTTGKHGKSENAPASDKRADYEPVIVGETSDFTTKTT